MKYVPHISLSVLFCLLGICLGILFDAVYHPNYMMVWVDETTHHLAIAPQENDIVQWETIGSQNNVNPVQIQFYVDNSGQIPCYREGDVNVDKGYCFVRPPFSDGTYQYGCKQGEKDGICDPNYGPSSPSGKGTGILGEKSASPKRLGAFQTLQARLYFPALLRNLFGSTPKSRPPTKGGSTVPSEGTRPLGPQGISLSVRCGGTDDMAHVYLGGTLANTIPFPPDIAISWSTYYSGFKVSNFNQICDPQNPNPCTVPPNQPDTTIKYTAEITDSSAPCHKPNDTEQIQIKSPTRSEVHP